MDPKLQAAIVAAINAYMDDQAAAADLAAKAHTVSRWRRQSRLEALKASQATFRRPGRWR